MERALSEFLNQISKEKNINLELASKVLESCILSTSIKLNKNYSDVFSIIHSEEFLLGCLSKSCDQLTLDECRKSCHCVEFEGKCISKKIKDADIINRNPDGYISTLSTEQLTQLVKVAAFLYYNYEGGGLTDNSYDALEYHLKKKLKIKERLYEKIGSEPIERIRIKLPYFMGSLPKIKPESKELFSYLYKNVPQLSEGHPPTQKQSDILISEKLDGVSCMVVYKNGKLDGMFTRGDGTIGGNVIYLSKFIKLPEKTSGDIVVRGELVLSREMWNSRYIGTYANPRSFVSAKVNSGYITPALSDIDFVAYEIIKIGNKEVPNPFRALGILQLEGFKVVKHFRLNTPTIFDLVNLYKERRKISEYEIDGLVLEYDIIQNDNMKKYAFKMDLEEQLRKTQVINVQWNITRYGKYFPVAVYESVYINGVRLHKASAHNAAHIRDWCMGVGTKIVVIRSGDVIPAIRDVTIDTNITPIYPPNTYPWVWETYRQKDIMLVDIEGNKEVQIARNLHFFSTIGVARLGIKTIEKLWDAGFKTVESVIRAKKTELIQIRGIGNKTADTIIGNIDKAISKTPIDRYLKATTSFKLGGIGRKMIKTIFRSFPEILNQSSETIKNILKKNKIKGIGPKRIDIISDGLPKFKSYLLSLGSTKIQESIKNYAKHMKELEMKGYNEKIQNKIFVFTGFMDNHNYELEDYIFDNYGDLSTTVTSDVTAVIAKSLGNVTKKMEDALSLKVPVYSIEEFCAYANIGFCRQKEVEEDEEDNF